MLSEAPAGVVSSWRDRVRIRGCGFEGRDQASGPMVAVVWRARRVMVSRGRGLMGLGDGGVEDVIVSGVEVGGWRGRGVCYLGVIHISFDSQ